MFADGLGLGSSSVVSNKLPMSLGLYENQELSSLDSGCRIRRVFFGHNENHELSSLGGWLQNLVIDNEDDIIDM